MIKIMMLSTLLLVTMTSYNMNETKSSISNEHEKLVEYIIEQYKVSDEEAQELLRFCDHLQCAEDFKDHVKRRDFEKYFRELLYHKRKQKI